MKTQDIKNIASAYKQVLEKKTLDPVNPDELKGTHAQRKDKDIDNDGKVDSTDKYLHTRRKAVKQAMAKEAKDYGPGHIGAVQKMLDKERDAKKAKDAMKKEEVEELDEISRDTARSYIRKASAHKTTGETPKKDRSSGVDLAGKKAYPGMAGKAKVMATEEVENLDELSKKTLGSYIKKATGDAMTKSFKAGDVRDKDSTDNRLKAMGRQVGIAKAANKLAKEEVELDEQMTPSHKKIAHDVHKQLKRDDSMSSGAGLKLKADHKMIRSKYGPDWRKKAGIKEGTEMNESRWPILNRIMERQNHGNTDNGSPRGEGLSPSAKAELARSEGDSGIDGVKAAADTARNAVAQVKVAPKRPGDKTDGDKTMPKNDGK